VWILTIDFAMAIAFIQNEHRRKPPSANKRGDEKSICIPTAAGFLSPFSWQPMKSL